MTRYVVDIEADNLLLDVTQVWCLVAKDIDSGQVHTFVGEKIEQGVRMLEEASLLILHNGIAYDLPVLKKFYGMEYDVTKVFDTLLASRMLLPDREGGHSLRAWGERIGDYKGDFHDFSKLSSEMIEYCIQDVHVTHKVFEYLKEDIRPIKPAMLLENKFAYYINRQILNGFRLDIPKIESLYSELQEEYTSIYSTLECLMPHKKELTHYRQCEANGLLLEKSETEYTYMTAKTKKVVTKSFKLIRPNPTSRQQIVEFFKQQYDWTPKKVTDKGNPEVNEKILSALPYREAEKFARLFRLQKQMSMIKASRGGASGWLDYVRGDRVNGNVNTIGANTMRCTHNCVPMDSQALTRDGWKTYDELVIGEEVLGYDLDTNTKKWTKITGLHKFDSAPVGSIGNQSTRFRCTPNHRWVVQNKNYKPKLREAKDLLKHDAILTNAPYENRNNSGFCLPLAKYGTNHTVQITNASPDELKAFLLGFLLADGCLKKSTNGDTESWSFAQAEGDILEAARVALYLESHTRISTTCKNRLKGENQRFGYNVTQTRCSTIRSKEGMEWVYENDEAVWCPTTELNTWVMRQGEAITITGNSPNMAQVDAKDKRMREVWIAREGWKLVGCDASGLELRILGHYLAPFDNGTFAYKASAPKEEVDLHVDNQIAGGLDKRDSAKTAIYALIYGAGDRKLGTVVAADKDIRGPSDQQLIAMGARLRQGLFEGMQGYEQLMKTVSRAFQQRGFLRAIDKRPLNPRNEHSALNLLIQSAGAIVMKQALINMVEEAERQGYVLDSDFALCGNVHDEWILECKPELADKMKEISVAAIRKTTTDFQLKVDLDGDARSGDNWYEIH